MVKATTTWGQYQDGANNLFLQRRLFMSIPLATLPLAACSQSNTGSSAYSPNTLATDTAGLSAEDIELKHRFRGIYGGQRRIDGLVKMNNVALHRENDGYFQNGSFGPGGAGNSSLGGKAFIVPKIVRMMWFSDEAIVKFNPFPPPAYEGGTLLADVTVPVASRFPIEVLDEARTKGAGLRLKLRVHPGGVMVGWDIERRPGFDPKKLDSYGEARYVAPVFSFAGGDFNEAKIYNGQVIAKGWYIHPKTGQKIEADF